MSRCILLHSFPPPKSLQDRTLRQLAKIYFNYYKPAYAMKFRIRHEPGYDDVQKLKWLVAVSKGLVCLPPFFPNFPIPPLLSVHSYIPPAL
jgi:hypothetical protein